MSLLRGRSLLVPVRCRSLLVLVLMCALLGCAVPASIASGGAGGPAGGGGPRASDGGIAVVRLLTQAADVNQQYEDGQRAARAQQARARRLQKHLTAERAQVTTLHGDLGRLARAQYRTGGALPQVAGLLLADDPDDLLRSERAVRQVRRAVGHAVTLSRRAAHSLAADQRKAARAWRTLDERTAHLAELRANIERTLRAAQSGLQGATGKSGTAGRCRTTWGPVRHALRWESLLRQAPVGRTWVAPLARYRLSAGYDSIGAHWSHRHTGQDFAVAAGTPVRAVGAGRVVGVSCGGPFGIEIVLAHPDGCFTQYAHLSAPLVDQGDEVRTGQWIGQSGSTGNSTGPHLHFEVRRTAQWGTDVDPVRWLAARGVRL